MVLLLFVVVAAANAAAAVVSFLRLACFLSNRFDFLNSTQTNRNQKDK